MRSATEAWFDALADSARQDLLDAAVWGTGWWAMAQDFTEGGAGLDRRMLGRLIDTALQEG